jgi:hypothetical protein
MMDGWFKLSAQMIKLGFESQAVILQRLSRLRRGGALADKEYKRMVSEKMTAAAAEIFSTGLAAAAGQSPLSMLDASVKSYRKKVAANRRRLERKPRKPR